MILYARNWEHHTGQDRFEKFFAYTIFPLDFHKIISSQALRYLVCCFYCATFKVRYFYTQHNDGRTSRLLTFISHETFILINCTKYTCLDRFQKFFLTNSKQTVRCNSNYLITKTNTNTIMIHIVYLKGLINFSRQSNGLKSLCYVQVNDS